MHTCPICHEEGISSFRRFTLARGWPTRCQACEGLVTAAGAERGRGWLRPPRASHVLVFVLGYLLGADRHVQVGSGADTAKTVAEYVLVGYVVWLFLAGLAQWLRNARSPLVRWESPEGEPGDA